MPNVQAEQWRPFGQDHLEDAVAAAVGSSDWFGAFFQPSKFLAVQFNDFQQIAVFNVTHPESAVILAEDAPTK
jgi:hypothetical protein